MSRHCLLKVLVAAAAVLVLGVVAVPFLALAVGPGPVPTSAISGGTGVPPRALAAYQAAATSCEGLRWELLAAVGWVESRHGSDGGAVIDPESGEVTPWIFGPELDGTGGTIALPRDEVGGWWSLGGYWERAVGPMQVLASTFSAWEVDGDGDGVANPHDLDDAAATAAAYLCGGQARIGDERAALFRYNRSDAYVEEVIAYAEQLASTVPSGGWLCPVTGPVSFTDTWGAPRSGGRRHQGVDVFAALGTPVVAPVPGLVEHYADTVGGLSFRLWGDDGTYYYGTHLAAFGTAGPVSAGAIIGYLGETGNARGTGPHLHFEIHPGRRPGDPPRPVNPSPRVAQACGAQRIGAGLQGGA